MAQQGTPAARQRPSPQRADVAGNTPRGARGLFV